MSRNKVFASVAFAVTAVVGVFLLSVSPTIVLAAIQAQPSKPVRILIPSAKVNAQIIPLGVTASGQLDTPHNFIQAGWYSPGIIPGQIGSAVIDGHVDNGADIPGPFKHLKAVKAGDKIEVADADGSIRRFTIVRTDIYTVAAFPSEQIFHDDGVATLKIITCYGDFIASKKTYDRRLVVTAVLDQMHQNLAFSRSTTI